MAGKNQLIDQCRKPAGWLGRFLLWGWNIRHSRVTDWGLRHVAIAQRDTILDVGCGGGRTVRKLAAVATQGRVCGVDHAEESVAAARRTNRHGIATGRVEIRMGSVSNLPFPTGTFDLVTAVETHFWWSDLPAGLREVLRVLKPGGRLAIIAEVYKGGKHDQQMQKLVELANMAFLTAAEHRELLVGAGYADVHITEERGKGWICGVGKKPS